MVVQRINRLLYLVILIFMLIGCSQINEQSLNKTSSPTERITSTNKPTIYPYTQGFVDLTPTLVPTSAAPSATSTETSQDTIPICTNQGLVNDLPGGFGISGTIIFQDSENKGLYTIGGSPLSVSKLPVNQSQSYEVFGFTPDGQRFAYAPNIGLSTATVTADASGVLKTIGTLAYDTPHLVLLSAQGERIEKNLDKSKIESDLPESDLNKVLSWPASYWINNNTLYMRLYYWDLDPYSRGNLRPILYDPFNGVWIQNLIKGIEHRNVKGNLGFSPDMTRVLYTTEQNGKNTGIQLVDVTSNLALWSDTKFRLGVNTIILWSPDSSMLIVSNMGGGKLSPDTYLLSRDGKVITIKNSTFLPSSDELVSLNWSPDSRSIVMIYSNGEAYRLLVYDREQNRYLYYCPLTTFDELSQPEPVWSPDGLYVILSSSFSDVLMQLFDIQTGNIYKLPEKGKASGWSDKFPTLWP